MPFEQRLFLGKESFRQKVQRPEVRAFTQNIYNVGESLFPDIWFITGFDLNLSNISPNYRCLYLCHNNQPKLLLIETVTLEFILFICF